MTNSRFGAALAAVLLVAGCSAAAPTPPRNAAGSAEGLSVVVLGHSGATGYDSDPRDPSRDALENSWATGTNPAVDSIAQRLAASDPRYRGHAVNLAQDGATVDDLAGQVARFETVTPAAGVVLVQVVDNDLRCDGTDAQNYAPFAEKLAAALRTVAGHAPAARIYVLSMWATAQSYADAVRGLPAARDSHTGEGVCDLLDASGAVRPQGVRYQQDLMDHYHAEAQRACGTEPRCTYDGGAMQRYPLVTADLTPDGNHLTADGHRKYAELAWASLFTR